MQTITKKYSIKEVSDITGIKAHTLRAWEKRYNFCIPQRDERNVRHYTEGDLNLFKAIKRLKNRGMRISDIAAMGCAEIRKCRNGTPDIEQLNSCLIGLTQFKDEEFINCFDNLFRSQSSVEMGIEFLDQLIEKINQLLLTGSLHAVQKKYIQRVISHYFISKLSAEQRKLKMQKPQLLSYQKTARRFDLQYLLAQYVFAVHNIRVVNLGDDISTGEVQDALHILSIDRVYTTLSEGQSEYDLMQEMQNLAERYRKKKFYISGYNTRNGEINHENIFTTNSLKDVIKAI